MHQDIEDDDFNLCSESHIDDRYWSLGLDSMDDNDREVLAAFIACYSVDIDQAIEKYQGAYYGAYDSFRDFAEQYFDEVNEIPDRLTGYIDYDAVARDYKADFSMFDGHVFCDNW